MTKDIGRFRRARRPPAAFLTDVRRTRCWVL